MMPDKPLYDRVMGRPAPDPSAPASEIAESASQFAGALVLRLATSVLGSDQMARSAAVTEAVKLDVLHRDRNALRIELQRFLKGSVQTQDVGIPVWLNLIGFGPEGACQTLVYAERYCIDTVDAGRAVLAGLDTDRTETLCHIAGMTGVSAFSLVCNALQIEADGRAKREAL